MDAYFAVQRQERLRVFQKLVKKDLLRMSTQEDRLDYLDELVSVVLYTHRITRRLKKTMAFLRTLHERGCLFRTGIIYCVMWCPQALDTLLRWGAALQSPKWSSTFCPLEYTIINRLQDEACTLIRAGLQSFTKRSYMHLAVTFDCANVIRELLDAGSDPFEREWGFSPAELSRAMGYHNSLLENLEDGLREHAHRFRHLEKELMEFLFHPLRLSAQGYFRVSSSYKSS